MKNGVSERRKSETNRRHRNNENSGMAKASAKAAREM